MIENKKIFEGLNENQICIAKHLFGPCCVIAGPGSGKTFVLVRKIANAIANGVDPSRIVLFTFTNKAAREIRERVETFIGDKAAHITIGTYHSVCCRILRQYIHYLGYDNHFSILDSEDSLKIVAELCKGTPLDARSIASYISKQKRNMISYEVAVRESTGINEKRAAIYRDYELRMRTQNSLDFDNLILLTIQLLEQYPEVREKLHQKYNYIIADEGQDSSPADLMFIRLLLNENNNLTLIGDLDQSIYSFRGVSIQHIIDFMSGLCNAETFFLNQNYRSSQTIVKASRTLIEKNPNRDSKQLFSANAPGDQIIYAEDQSPQAEALRIAQFIKLMQQKEYAVKYNEIMILYRTNMQSAEIEKMLLKFGLPYRIVGNIHFYARKEVKDLICYLRFAFNPYDYESFKRAVNTPKRGLGEASLQKIYTYACANNIDLLTALSDIKALKLSKKGASGVIAFAEIITALRDVYMFLPPSDALNYLIATIDYEAILSDDEEKESRMQNIAQLQELAMTYASLEELLEQSSLSNDDYQKEDKVTLMTIHASKGLESDCVIIAGCSEGLMPFSRAIEFNAIEEERRLAYVAMTRARKYLFMTRSKSVFQNGQFKPVKESRFMKEIAEEFIFKIPPAKAK